MNDNDLPSDSDESDVDYVPTGKEEGLSEEDSGPESGDNHSGDEVEGVAKKRKKTSKKSRKKKKIDNPAADEAVEQQPLEVSEEEKKKKADALWADFMKDCGPPKPKTVQVSGTVKSDVSTVIKDSDSNSEPLPKKEKIKITEIFEFAGEKVSVEKEVDVSCSKMPVPASGARGGRGRGRGGGLSSVLSHLGKSGKLSTLEKSKLDWDRFKSEEGIKEDLEKHNKGKHGYLSKQDFLERADLRQFEIEKEMRSKARRTLNR